MSDADLATLVQLSAAFNERGWAAVFPLLHPDFEFHEPPEQPGSGVFHGHAAAREGFARWAETWREQRSEPQSFEVLDDGRILVFTRERMLGRDGVRVEQDSGQLFTFRDGKILRWQVFWDRENARRAAASA